MYILAAYISETFSGNEDEMAGCVVRIGEMRNISRKDLNGRDHTKDEDPERTTN
jgi:hypothetical protein